MLFLSDELLKGMWVPNMQQNEAALRARTAHELRRLHALFQALTVENEILHAENESLRASFDTLRAGYDAARLEIESLQKAATDRHALQATGAHPAPCARYCEAVAFNIERRNLHAENERLRTCNKDAQHEIANLQDRVQELGQMARDVNSRRVQELEAQLAAVAAPKKWAPEEVEDGGRGIRWVTNEGVHGRPTDHDVREYLKRTPTANGCHCDDCKRFYAAASDVTAAPAQAGEHPPLVCDYCGALTPDPWHSSGMLHGKI